jgi:thiamine-monophosphate kinase
MPDAVPGLELGFGDDCALLRSPYPLAVTTDMLVDGVHFSLDYMTFEEIGFRAMAANLSDLAAMGASPAFGLLSLGLPAGDSAQVEQLLQGMLGLAARHGLILVGGDTVKAPLLTINLCLLGRIEHTPLKRSLAKVGHSIWLTGPLGLSGAGLYCLRNHMSQEGAWQSLIAAHKKPVPRVEAGLVLARSGIAGGVMDISDGLATDLARMCQSSHVGATVKAEALPLSETLLALARITGQDPLQWALRGGEDFELLFTCTPAVESQLAAQLRQTGLNPIKIGRVNAAPGVFLQKQNQCHKIDFQGFDHFA